MPTKYYWKPYEFGKCSVECGMGTQKRKIYCCKKAKRQRKGRRRSMCIRVPMTKCAEDEKPSNTQECRSECHAQELPSDCRDKVSFHMLVGKNEMTC